MGSDDDDLVKDVIRAALAKAAESNEELSRRARMAIDGLQSHVMKDGGRKVMNAGRHLMPVLSVFGGQHALTPGELALVLSATMHNVLLSLPGMTPDLARAIAIELASG